MQGWARGSKSKSELNEPAANGLVFYIFSYRIPVVTRACWNVTKHVGFPVKNRCVETFDRIRGGIDDGTHHLRNIARRSEYEKDS